MKIYTKTGDKGMTSLCDGSRLSKDDMRIEAYGTLDELNANIGLLISLLHADTSKEEDPVVNPIDILVAIQEELFVIGGQLACADMKEEDYLYTQKLIKEIEINIDKALIPTPCTASFCSTRRNSISSSKSCLSYNLSPCRT